MEMEPRRKSPRRFVDEFASQRIHVMAPEGLLIAFANQDEGEGVFLLVVNSPISTQGSRVTMEVVTESRLAVPKVAPWPH